MYVAVELLKEKSHFFHEIISYVFRLKVLCLRVYYSSVHMWWDTTQFFVFIRLSLILCELESSSAQGYKGLSPAVEQIPKQEILQRH
jgi:hypothetical protein